VLSRCSKLAFLLFSGLVAPALAQEEGRTSTEGGEWLERSRELIEESANREAPDWMRTDPGEEALAIAEEIARESGMRPDKPQREVNYAPGSVLICGSFSMPDETIRNLMDAAKAPDVTFVLRGLVGDTNIRQTLDRVKTYVTEGETVPKVIIDPTLYKKYEVTAAPTLVLLREDGLPPVSVVGAVPVDWLRRQASSMTASTDPDLGIRAEYYDIAEADLILEMQRRVAGIDWSTKRQVAIDDFWRNKSDFIDLPVAEENREFEIDPSVRVTQDIQDADGKVLVYAGETFNPLDYIPLTKTVVVFRGTDPAQLAYATEIAGQVRAEGRGVILLTTTVDTSQGWNSIHGMEQDLRSPVYLLQADLAQRFQLQHVPSTVNSRGNRLVVNEHAIARRQDE